MIKTEKLTQAADVNYILLFGFLGLILLTLMAVNYIIRRRIKNSGEDSLVLGLISSLRNPFILAVLVFTLFTIVNQLITIYIVGDSSLINLSSNLSYIAIAAIVTLYLIKAFNLIENHYRKKYPPLQTALNMFNTIGKVVVIIISGLIILERLGVNISRILAVGGIGGVALGFASKDLFANFFGFFVIILDRPFKVGDLISSTDKDIRGTVESISWRVTKVINLEKRPIYIPNALFTTIIVQNETRALARRIKENLKYFYKSAEDIDSFLKRIREFFASRTELTKNFDQVINLVKIAKDIVEFEIALFVKANDNNEFMRMKQEILVEIARLSSEFDLKSIFPDVEISIQESYKNI